MDDLVFNDGYRIRRVDMPAVSDRGWQLLLKDQSYQNFLSKQQAEKWDALSLRYPLKRVVSITRSKKRYAKTWKHPSKKPKRSVLRWASARAKHLRSVDPMQRQLPGWYFSSQKRFKSNLSN